MSPAAFTAESNQTSAQYGDDVSTAGDVNGDGFGDVIVGVPWFSNGQSYEGRACVYHGSASGLLPTAAFTPESNQANAHYGSAVATAGDVNGDGYADVIVGAPLFTNGQPEEGRAWVYHGSASGLISFAAFRPEGNQAGATYALAVATAGDVNGDGFADIIIGAPGYDNGQTDEGRAELHFGPF
jgi:hypothetical protein